MHGKQKVGFTLIEMSIVLVIIGLIIGGLLVGQSMIEAATIRSQISQIEKYNTAVNAFRTKYNCLPGDCAQAAQFGFIARGTYPGEGDGNGVIQGINASGVTQGYGNCESAGETPVFWEDLSAASLIEGSFNTATSSGYPGSNITSSSLPNYFPKAKLGNGNYVYVYSGGYYSSVANQWASNYINYFGILNIILLNHVTGGAPVSNPNISVQQASAIDNKMDDGLPQTGRVIAQYIAGTGTGIIWANGVDTAGVPYTSITAGSSTTCYDNSSSSTGSPGVSGATQHYSTEINNGAGENCALSFQFQ